MIIRIVSGLVGLVALVPLMVIGGVWLQIGLTVVVVIGMWEFYRAFGDISLPHFLALALAVAYLAFIGTGYVFAGLWPLAFVVILLLVAYMAFVAVRRESFAPHKAGIALFGLLYIAIMLSAVYLLREGHGMGVYVVWIAFISAWGCDTGAYFTGLTMGKHKMAPVLSPKKTWEGAVGGTMVATILAAAYGFVLYNLGIVSFAYVLIFALTAFVCSIAGQIGDLAASAIKRSRKLKDYGNIMPGHGGVLDRFDSIIFTAPLAFVILTFVERLI